MVTSTYSEVAEEPYALTIMNMPLERGLGDWIPYRYAGMVWKREASGLGSHSQEEQS